MNCLLASDEETEAYLLPGFPANYLPVKKMITKKQPLWVS
jgi:hypothetical protein